MTTQSDSSQTESGYLIDAESSTEMARLLHQDIIITQAMGKLFPERSDLMNIHDVLDIACGPGGWVLEVAREYPDIQVTGVDICPQMIEYARAHAKARGLDNAHFIITDILKPLEFPNASFDLVNARALVGLMTPTTWPILMQELFRVCRPSGTLRLTEGEYDITNSPAAEQLGSMFTQALRKAGRSFSPDGRHIGITPMLAHFLRDIGCENIQTQAHLLDLSAGTPNYQSWYQNYMIALQMLQPFLIKTGLTTQEEVEPLYQEALAEILSDNFCGVAFMLTAYGTKPQFAYQASV